MNQDQVIEALRAAAHAIRSSDDLDCVRAIQTAQDALDAVKSTRLASIEAAAAYDAEGSSSLAAWARLQLRVSNKEARMLARGADTMRQLPLVGAAAEAGQIRAEHINVFTYGLKHIGIEIMLESQGWLLEVARKNDPTQLFQVMKSLRAAVFPEELDEAWKKGMDKQDFNVSAVEGGYHVRGFLNVTAGAKLQKVLDSLSAPRDADDKRSGSERRVQAIEDLADSVLDNGLPSDQGFRPHVSVAAGAEAVEAALTEPELKPADPYEAAVLAGFGPIGPAVLAMILCGADATTVLMQLRGGQADVLNVGHTQRLATKKQRIAVIARQAGVCAAPGCTHTHLHVHHVIWWRDGGPTDLDNLVGLCSRCHHLVHRKLLNVRSTGDGDFDFTNSDNRPLIADYRKRYAAHIERGRILKTAQIVRNQRQRREQLLRT